MFGNKWNNLATVGVTIWRQQRRNVERNDLGMGLTWATILIPIKLTSGTRYCVTLYTKKKLKDDQEEKKNKTNRMNVFRWLQSLVDSFLSRISMLASHAHRTIIIIIELITGPSLCVCVLKMARWQCLVSHVCYRSQIIRPDRLRRPYQRLQLHKSTTLIIRLGTRLLYIFFPSSFFLLIIF